VVVGAGVERLHLVRLVAAGRQDDDRDPGPLAQPAGELDAVAVRQAEVEEDELRVVAGGGGGGLARAARLDQAEAVRAERGAQEAAHRRLVFDDEDQRADLGHGSSSGAMAVGAPLPSGRLRTKRAPPPGRFAATTSPPWARAMPRAIGRPSPTPRVPFGAWR